MISWRPASEDRQLRLNLSISAVILFHTVLNLPVY